MLIPHVHTFPLDNDLANPSNSRVCQFSLTSFGSRSTGHHVDVGEKTLMSLGGWVFIGLKSHWKASVIDVLLGRFSGGLKSVSSASRIEPRLALLIPMKPWNRDPLGLVPGEGVLSLDACLLRKFTGIWSISGVKEVFLSVSALEYLEMVVLRESPQHYHVAS